MLFLRILNQEFMYLCYYYYIFELIIVYNVIECDSKEDSEKRKKAALIIRNFLIGLRTISALALIACATFQDDTKEDEDLWVYYT